MEFLFTLPVFCIIFCACSQNEVVLSDKAITAETVQVDTLERMTGVSLEMPAKPLEGDQMNGVVDFGAKWVAMIPYGYTERGAAKAGSAPGRSTTPDIAMTATRRRQNSGRARVASPGDLRNRWRIRRPRNSLPARPARLVLRRDDKTLVSSQAHRFPLRDAVECIEWMARHVQPIA